MVLRSDLDLKMVASARPMVYIGQIVTHRCQYPELILRDVSQIRGVQTHVVGALGGKMAVKMAFPG